MKKIVFGFVMAAVLVSAFALTSSAYAQAPAQFGQGGGRGYRGSSVGATAPNRQAGILHAELVAAFAEKLGLPADEINTRLENGETLSQIAASSGYTFEDFQALMVEVRTQAINEAVAAGEITQAQADWMLQHGFGIGPSRGAGAGRFANPNCPYTLTVNP